MTTYEVRYKYRDHNSGEQVWSGWEEIGDRGLDSARSVCSNYPDRWEMRAVPGPITRDNLHRALVAAGYTNDENLNPYALTMFNRLCGELGVT